MTYIALCYINTKGSNIWGLHEQHIAYSNNLYDACVALYSYYVKTEVPEDTTYSYFIEKYDNPYCNDGYMDITEKPLRVYRFDGHFNCIDNDTSEIVWQP